MGIGIFNLGKDEQVVEEVLDEATSGLEVIIKPQKLRIGLDPLQRRLERSMNALTPSLAGQMAKDTGQALVDGNRARLAMKVGREVGVAAIEEMATNYEYAEAMSERHPDLAADIAQVFEELAQYNKQLPRVAMVGYMRRHHKNT